MMNIMVSRKSGDKVWHLMTCPVNKKVPKQSNSNTIKLEPGQAAKG